MALFQSYLFAGTNEDTRNQSRELAKKLGTDLNLDSTDATIVSIQKSAISIDQIRDIKKHIYQKPFKSPYKFIIIQNADTLTHAAQNALLKILEEPPPHAIIILEAKNKENLLPTIRSRVKTTVISPEEKSRQSTLFAQNPKDLAQNLSQISTIENPKDWLNEEISALYDLLVKAIGANHQTQITKICTQIKMCAYAKSMIEANVNAKFVLANLVFSLNSK